MFKGAFGAGLAKGFGTTLAEGIEERRKEREKYLDLTIDNARKAAPGLAASEAEVTAMAGMYEQMNNDFGITKEEFLGLAENYDINSIYKNVYTAKTVMEKNGINGMLDKSMILGGLKVADQYQFSGSVEDGLRMIFQGTTANVDPNNKSEAHRMGAFGKAVAEGLALNPRRSAEEMAQGMQVAGVPVERLLQFQASGGVKQTPFSQLEATGPFSAIEIDYTDAQFKTTTNTFASVFSRKFAGTDDPTDLAAILQGNADALSNFGKDATAEAVYNEVFAAGNTMARLEKQLIGKGLNVGMGAANTRYDALAGVASRLESVEEMQQLVRLIEAGDPVADRIVEAYSQDQMITDKEMDYILTGERTVTEEDNDTIVTPTEPEDKTITEQTDEALEDFEVKPSEEEQLEAAEAIPTVADPDVPGPLRQGTEGLTMFPDEGTPELVTQLPEDVLSEDTPFTANLKRIAGDQGLTVEALMNTAGPEARALAIESMKEAWAPQMAQYTKKEWKEMGRDERLNRGLPVRPIDMWAAGSSNFKDQTPWYEAFSKRPQIVQGDPRSRLDEAGQVKAEVAAEEQRELFDDINSAVLESALDDKPTFDTVFEAREFAEQWLKDNIPDHEEWMTETGYTVDKVALLMYNNLGPKDETPKPTAPSMPVPAAPEVSSIVDDVIQN